MRTIVIASPKGGTGKNIIAGHLAVEAERRVGGPQGWTASQLSSIAGSGRRRPKRLGQPTGCIELPKGRMPCRRAASRD